MIEDIRTNYLFYYFTCCVSFEVSLFLRKISINMYKIINFVQYRIRGIFPKFNSRQKIAKVDAPILLSKSKVPKITLEDTLYNMNIIQRPQPNNHTFKLMMTYLIAFFCVVYFVQHMTPSTENATRILQELEDEERKMEKN